MWEQEVLKLTEDKGADVTLDVAGGDGINQSVLATKVGGIVAQIGFLTGQTSKLELDKRGYIETDESLATSMAGVYAGGDIVTGAATVIEAMGAGRKAARSIKSYLGISDEQRPAPSKTLFGIDVRERNFVRIRTATNAETAGVNR